MSPAIIIALILVVILSAGALFLALGFPNSGSRNEVDAIRNLVASQRTMNDARPEEKKRGAKNAMDVSRKLDLEDKPGPKLERTSLQKRLNYAQWRIAPKTFKILRISFAICGAALAKILGLNILWIFMGGFMGSAIMVSLLNRKIQNRFKRFDADYPNFLLSLVGLLKTGMNPMQAIEAAASGLDDDSLVKFEARMMVERLRFGVLEDKSIGAFGEEVDHPEIELFVQALLLSRRLGGTLSDTLERLSKQVRKRQYFRQAAQAAVAMARGSVWVILGILVALEAYIGYMFPELIMEAFNFEIGKQVWQVGIFFIVSGLWWVRQVTKIRV